MAWYMTFYQGLVQLATTSLLLLIVASAAILAIRQPARRIRVIEWTLAGLLLLPGLALVPAYPRWSILPKFDAPASPAVVLMERMESTEQVDTWPSRAIETSAEPLEEPTEEVLIASVKPRMIVEADVYTEVLAQPTTSSATVPISPEGKWEFALPRDFRFWIVIAYLSGVAGMALWSLVGLVALKRLLRSARPADAACRGLLREIAGPRSDRVSLVVSSRAGQPCAFAWRRVTIVLPRELCNPEDSQKLRWALAHEWSHVERGDVWSWSASGIVRWFYFYQPLVWWLRRHLQLSQDFVADSQAAHSGKLPEDYAEFLTSWSAGYSRPTLAAGLGIGGRISDLKRRVVMLVENHHPLETASPRKWNLAVFPLAILILAAVACVGEQPAGAEPRQAAEPQADATKPVIAEAPQPVQSSEPQTEPAKPAIAGEPVPAQSAKPQAEASKPTAAEAPNPGEPRRVRPHAVPAQVRDPSRPRMIATGDVLIVDVVPNIESPADGQARVLLRPEMKLVVDESGMISLGSRYGSVSVRDLNLNKAQEQIHNLLVSQNAKRTDVTSLSDINVRVMFAEPAVNKAAKALTAT
ncbi:MAG TPA: M56 family metallopeptidase, partial [Pirellulales bacterium]|nr:M56 family metallopeptidase [Pirellulales bacterium]